MFQEKGINNLSYKRLPTDHQDESINIDIANNLANNKSIASLEINGKNAG